MNGITVKLDNNILVIEKERKRKTNANLTFVDLNTIHEGKVYSKKTGEIDEEQKNKVLLFKKIQLLPDQNDGFGEEDKVDNTEVVDDEDNVKDEGEESCFSEEEMYVLVYTTSKEIKYIYTTELKAYKKLISLKHKVINMKLTKKGVSFSVLAYIINKYNLPITSVNFQIGDCLKKPTTLDEFSYKLSKKELLFKRLIKKYKFSMEEILSDETFINGDVKFVVNIAGKEVPFQIGKKNKKIKKKKDYYIPMYSKYINNYAVHIRRTMNGNLVLVKRLIEPIEKTFKFRILESKFLSAFFHLVSLLRIGRKKVNLYFEKFSEKAEEGTFELCKMVQSSKNSKNYFIIDKNSSDYNKINKNKFVVPKYSLKYYWILYNANTFIATETQMHSNILRSNNKYLRKNINRKQFVFLQHGIIFMKNLGKNSTFIKGREAEPSYMVVSSDYEKEVVMDMLNLPEERLLKTGLALYGKLKYKHISNDSDDFITIMLTWKPYEEYLINFEESSYYQNVISIYNMLSKHINPTKIRIVAHPKVSELLESTSLNDLIWKDTISNCLESTKVLITDYSSVCYNSFYQGSGVIFYQPDLDIYEKENGELIPTDEEYVGRRAFNIGELEQIVERIVDNDRISLNYIRNDVFESNYMKINEFRDGKNIERIYQNLKNLDLV